MTWHRPPLRIPGLVVVRVGSHGLQLAANRGIGAELGCALAIIQTNIRSLASTLAPSSTARNGPTSWISPGEHGRGLPPLFSSNGFPFADGGGFRKSRTKRGTPSFSASRPASQVPPEVPASITTRACTKPQMVRLRCMALDTDHGSFGG